eukprot:Pgem_evm1s8975
MDGPKDLSSIFIHYNIVRSEGEHDGVSFNEKEEYYEFNTDMLQQIVNIQHEESE